MEKHPESKNSKLQLHFNLKQMCNKEKLTQIMMTTTVNKQRIRVYTKLRIEPKYWDKSNARCKTGQHISLREKNRLQLINQKLSQLEASVYQEDERLAECGHYMTGESLRKKVIENGLTEKAGVHPTAYLYKQVDDYLEGMNRRGKRGIASTQRTYLTALKRLDAFCHSSSYPLRSFDDFDHRFFTAFANYLYSCSYQKGKERKQYTQNTVVNTIKVVKNLLHRAYDNEMTNNNYYQKVQTVLPADATEKIYLNEKEISRLAKLQLTLQTEKNIRDMFVISCYTALRISDIQKMNDAVISNGVISLYQTKTKEPVSIPILKEIAPLIAYYSKNGFPAIDVCKANEVIKDLARRCHIDQDIKFKEHRGGVEQIKTLPKWKLISFHTARRSCITNLYKRGYPVNYIMTLSGHHSLQSFQRYIRATNKELTSNFVTLLKKERAL